ncbi:paralemmin-1-like [Boleophthalmus pectinirostris]|uniref:paralemmin-1-like n=1 Tax=Boleophthalmus pectinirostris TaxID=150288 RepID=UPI00242A6698|nr:paralemmin-1-like [Boleophthalmus pectinirostris]
MAQRIYHESGHEGRSVLGMLAVQVEKDPKTGATIVRSVTPVSGTPDSQLAPTIFDDGRKSIHAVGGSAEQPSSEELGQILSVIDGVGMTALLDDVTITPKREITKVEVTKSGQGKAVSSNQLMPSVNNSKGPDFKEKDRFANVSKTVAATEVRQKTLVIDSSPQVEMTESEMLCEGPVTLMFMGYTDGRGDGEDLGVEEPQGMLTAERVIITDDGEELVIGPDSIAPSQKPAEDMAAQKAPKESQDKAVFQEVPLEGQKEQVPQKVDEGENGHQKSESTAEGQGKPKRKTCQCCTVM